MPFLQPRWRRLAMAVAAAALAGCSGSPAEPDGPPPPPPNSAPVIQSITASASKIEIDQSVELTAVVQDQESTADKLQFIWTAPAGVFSGTGAHVTWRPPSSGFTTPADPVLTLTVVEPYPALDAQGRQVTREHRVSGTVSVRVHDSPTEISNMARGFLEAFSKQIKPAEDVVKDFRDGCGFGGRGKIDELADVQRNQQQRRIDMWSVGTPQVKIKYGGECPFRNRAGDACAQVSVDWWDTQLVAITDGSTVYPAGTKWHSYGTDQVTAEYHENRWWLCDSDFDGSSLQLAGTAVLKRLPGSFFKK